MKKNIQNAAAELLPGNAFFYGIKFFANSVAVNLNAAADVAMLGSARLRNSVEMSLQQVDALTHCRNVKTATIIQQAYAKKLREELAENVWVNVGLVMGNMKENIHVTKLSLEQTVPAQKAL